MSSSYKGHKSHWIRVRSLSWSHFTLMTVLKALFPKNSHSEALGVKVSTYEWGVGGDTIHPMTKVKSQVVDSPPHLPASRQCWQGTPFSQGCNPPGSGNTVSFADPSSPGTGSASTSFVCQRIPCIHPGSLAPFPTSVNSSIME